MNPVKKIVMVVASSIVALLVVGVAYVALQCPCERTPGFFLSGEVNNEPVSDWAFANDAGLCQLQVSNGILLQSLNLNCMSGDGELYLSCAQCDGKRWSSTALEYPAGKIRIADTVYPVSLSRVTDPEELDFAWQARANKLRRPGREVQTQRPDHWWSFKLTSK